MRILVTKQGNAIIQEIDDTSPIIPQTITNFNNSKNFRAFSTGYQIRSQKNNKPQTRLNKFSKTNNQFYNYSLFSNQSQSQKFFGKTKNNLSKNISKMNLDDMEITKEEINTAKKIKILEKKIPFPKQFAEKYENNSINSINSSNIIFPSINSKIKESYEGSNNSLVKREKYLSLGEIIPNKLKNQMKKKIIYDRKIRDKATIITQNDFRSEYDPETDIQKFNNILSDSKVNSNKSSLIKYLNEKKVNPLTIKLISNRDGNKINKINKMCQIIFQNEDKEKLFNDLVKKKINESYE